MIEWVLDKRMSEIGVHNSLHGIRPKRGCGTGTMEAKLAHQLAFVEQAPLFRIFVDLLNAYNVKDLKRCIDICVEARMGPTAVRLIIKFFITASTAVAPVERSHNRWRKGVSKMRAEDLKTWLKGV